MYRLLLCLLLIASAAECADTESPNYVGCFTDSENRQLKGGQHNSHLNTPDFCIGLCHAKGYPLAGVQIREQCFCGSSLTPGTKLDDQQCDTPCAGDESLMCGGGWRLSVYRTAIPGKGFNPVRGSYLGCFADSDYRTLSDHRTFSPVLTPDFCVNYCQKRGYSLSGVEVGKECFCGNSLTGGEITMDSECSDPCSGDESLICGGPWRLSVYKTSISGVDAVGSNYIGCYVDTEERQLTGGKQAIPSLTPDLCVSACYKKGFSLAGLEVGVECFCGDALREGKRADETECNQTCSGDNHLRCGGAWRLSLYRTSALGKGFNPVSSNYLGCFRDSKDRQLNAVKVVKKLITPDLCVTICRSHGFRLAGLQAGTECFCGDTLTENSQVDDDECGSVCSGDFSLKCGGDWRLSVYKTGMTLSPTQFLGCFVEYIEDRLFSGASVDSEFMTVDYCVGFCYRRGFLFAGIQYGEGCFCGNSLKQREKSASEDCGIPCNGDKNQKCGGHWRISVYSTGLTLSDYTDAHLPNYVGCYKDTVGRQLHGARRDSVALTPDVCSSFCYRKGYRLAGLQVGEQCFCGDNLKEGTEVNDRECDRKCFGDVSQFCGGGWRNSVYRTTVPSQPTNSYILGCFEEPAGKQILIGPSKLTDYMSVDYCVGFCYRRGFVFAGLKSGSKCSCGNTLNERNDKALSDCDMVCAGDKTVFCGGHQKVSIYQTGLTNTSPEPVVGCVPSKTTVNGRSSCRHQILFKEDFRKGFIDKLKWSHSRYMPSVPDNEFVVFGDSPQNIYTKNGILFIKPSLNTGINPETGQIQIADCTGELGGIECSRQAVYFSILPPVASARIHTKDSFSFRYGTVQVRAKLPVGDWIIPEIWLIPKDNSYGPNYASGKIRLAMSRGNKNLRMNGTEIGNKRLEAGLMLGIDDDVKVQSLEWEARNSWNEDFHKFVFTWTPDNFFFTVDGGDKKELLTADGQKLSDLFTDREGRKIWGSGSRLAPFDKEFYVSFGVSVGGIRDFPDGCETSGKTKPWMNFDAKAMLNFWRDKNNWYSTWNGEEAALQIDYIKVSAL